MKILIIGGTKFIGKAVANLAARAGHEVVLFNRGLTDENPTFKTIQGDVDRLVEYRNALLDLRADVVIHAIAYTEKHARDIVTLFSGSGGRLVVLSSQDCYEAFYQINHGRDVAELPIPESGPLCNVRHYWKDSAGAKAYPDYDKNLVTAEILSAHATGKVRATVLRLPMVFGPGDFQFRHRHGKFIRRIYDRQRTIVMGAIEQGSLFTFGYIDNIAAAILHAAAVTKVDGTVFNLGEGHSRSLRRWAELYGEAADVPFTFTILPDALTQNDKAAIDMPPRLILFDTRAFAEVTGFVEPVSLAAQIKATLAWGLEHPDALGPRPDYEMENHQREAYCGFLSSTLMPQSEL